MSRTLTVEGDLATVDAISRITTQGSVTAPSLIIPANTKKIARIIVTAAADGLAVGSAVFFVRIGGNGIKRGEQVIVISAAGVIGVQVGSDAAPQIASVFILEDADIEVEPTDTLTISGEMAGSDLGTGRIAVTLIFS